jgi:hypothetical protein
VLLSGDRQAAVVRCLGVTAPKVITTVKSVQQANEVRLLCPHCNSGIYVRLEWPFLKAERQRRISAAIDLHRRNCAKAHSEEGRVYRIDYPRG